MEREDIQALASALYKIPKTVEKIGERILICPEDLHGHNFHRQVELLDRAPKQYWRWSNSCVRARIFARLVRSTRGYKQSKAMPTNSSRVLHELDHSDHSPKHIIFLRDLYELLEKVIDRCRDAGNIILQIVLKYA